MKILVMLFRPYTKGLLAQLNEFNPRRQLTYPKVYIPELVGAAIIIWFTVELVRRKKVFAFIKYGQVMGT